MASQCHPQLIKHAKGGANSRPPPSLPPHAGGGHLARCARPLDWRAD